MNKRSIYILIPGILVLGFALLSSCEKDSTFDETQYFNQLSFNDSSQLHPKATLYQDILDQYLAGGGVGVSVMIRDSHGTWLGTAGYADLASGVELQPGMQFLVASVSKLFTATATFALIEEGLLGLDDPVNHWIDKSICDEIINANESSVKDLLGHTSGIRDLYNFPHLMRYMNRKNNHWDDRDMLEYIYGKKPYYSVGEAWYYSNVNYLLLGMILEEASGKTLSEVYEDKIFRPLGLESAVYDVGDNRVPEGLVKGYTDINSNNMHVEALHIYQDDVGIGGDGGIAINAQDLGAFMDALMQGQVIGQASLDQMTDWFEGGYSTDGMAGYGIYLDEGDYGTSIGHGGGIIGWEAAVDYFPGQDVTLAWMINTDLILSTESYDDNFNRFLRGIKEAIFRP